MTALHASRAAVCCLSCRSSGLSILCICAVAGGLWFVFGCCEVGLSQAPFCVLFFNCVSFYLSRGDGILEACKKNGLDAQHALPFCGNTTVELLPLLLSVDRIQA